MSTEDDLVEAAVPSDAELFEGATAPVTAETPETDTEATGEQPETEAEGQPRAPNGQFAPKAGEQPPADVTQPPAETDNGKDAMVPSWRLREVREAGETAVQQLRRELDELRRNPPKTVEPPRAQEPPDPLLDPVGYQAHMRTEFQEMLRNERGEISMELARDQHGEKFDAAYAAARDAIARGDAAVRARIMDARNPGKALMAWHAEQETVREVGSDPAAYKQRVLDEAMKDPAFLAKAVAAARTPAPGSNVTGLRQPSPVRLPPTLSTVAPSGSARGTEGDDVSDEGLYRHATAGMR